MLPSRSGTNTVAIYSYDGANRRIIKGIYVSGTFDHNEHAYFNESWQVAEVRKEVSGTISSNPLEQYIWHPFYVDALIRRDYDVATSGSPVGYYYTFDANYNVTASTTSSGVPTERYYYSPYGSLIFLDGGFTLLATQQSQIGNSVAYMGRQNDAESGLDQFRARIYHPQLGQFTKRDPIGYTADLHLYLAFRNRPIDLTDPSGNGPTCPGGGKKEKPPCKSRPSTCKVQSIKKGDLDKDGKTCKGYIEEHGTVAAGNLTQVCIQCKGDCGTVCVGDVEHKNGDCTLMVRWNKKAKWKQFDPFDPDQFNNAGDPEFECKCLNPFVNKP
jgi:RHS repeat-associated protein